MFVNIVEGISLNNMFVNIVLELLLVTIRDRYVIFPEYNTPLVDYFYFLFLHDKRTVYTDKAIGWKLFFHCPHTD